MAYTDPRSIPSPYLGAEVEVLRGERGLTRAGLARKAGVTERTVRKIEGGTSPTVSTLRLVAEALGTTADALLARARLAEARDKRRAS